MTHSQKHKHHVIDGNSYISVEDIFNITKSNLDEHMEYKTWIAKSSSDCFPKEPRDVIYSTYKIIEKDKDNNFMVTYHDYVLINLIIKKLLFKLLSFIH